MRVFLGVTGAFGAPYTARILEVLTEADCEVGVCASSAGIGLDIALIERWRKP